jgi:putative transposase
MQASQADATTQAATRALPIRTMARLFAVSHSGYYDWLSRAPCKREQANVALLTQIRQAHAQSDETYGMPRIKAELADLGICASKKRIASVMRANGIRGVSRRRGFMASTQRNKSHAKAPDLVKRQFTADAPNVLWVADMTYIPTWAGFLYLAVVIDAYSRKVVGWAMGNRQTAELVTQALNMALFTRKPYSVIHHSDQGSQYTSLEFGRRCKEMNVRTSMGSVGDAFDKAMAESFFASLECELIDRRSWPTQSEPRIAVFAWIEAWYNPRRRHCGLGQMSPVAFELMQAQRRQSEHQAHQPQDQPVAASEVEDHAT